MLRDLLPSVPPAAGTDVGTWPDPMIGIAGCQYIAAETAATDAAKCGLPVVADSVYCAIHRRRCVRPPLPFEVLLRLADLGEDR